ncbi:MAG: alpha/beta hydrolase [Desulfobacteraceae bacterium]|nr:alpha/beta hydrolase [Desulfobacteraceae bacterium]MBC2757615.1 alpha/beta hydrolase [Desulfobacteraceae bacterium]
MKKYFLICLTIIIGVYGCKVDIGDGDIEWHHQIANESEYFDMEDYNIHYIDIGNGLPVFMVHGFADSTYCWHKNMNPLLAAGFRTILIDQPGMGLSGMPPEEHIFSIENQASAVIALADHLGLKQFDIVGSSMGGGISLYLSLKYPEKIRKTIVIDPACYEPPGRVPMILSLPGAETIASVFAGKWTVKGALKDVYFEDSKVDQILIDEYARPMNKPGYMHVITSLRTQYFSDEFHNMTENHGKLKTQLLVIWGENDAWIPLEFGKKLHSIVPGSELRIIEQCGHMPHQEKPDEVNPLIIEFLNADMNHGKIL